jgi:hypothetical protein
MADDPRYPIGPFTPPGPVLTETERRAAIADIAALPQRMHTEVDGLTNQQIDTPYRPGGWTVRQLVHHVADSHLHAYIRLKLALTQETPTIVPYSPDSWAELQDSRLPVDVSLALLDALHARWTALYEGMDAAAFRRTFLHPEFEEPVSLDRQLATYSWHSRHHAAHVTALRRREGW